jgi:hypothetical protein
MGIPAREPELLLFRLIPGVAAGRGSGFRRDVAMAQKKQYIRHDGPKELKMAERKDVTHFVWGSGPPAGRQLEASARFAAESTFKAQAEVLPAEISQFITATSSAANTYVQSSVIEIGELIGRELEATEASDSGRRAAHPAVRPGKPE